MEAVNIRGSAKPWAVEGAKTVFFNLGTTQLEAYDVLTDMANSIIHEPGIDSPLAEVSSSGTLTFYHQDWLGNVAMLTNAGRAKVQTYTYDVWGKPSGFDASGLSLPVSGFSSRLLYTGREYDRETGLYHYRARAYSPTLGWFLQSDPIDFSAGDANLFRYVSNSPVNWVDALGVAIVNNNTGRSIGVSGNAGAGHGGGGGQVYGNIPNGATGGGTGDPVTGYNSPGEARNAADPNFIGPHNPVGDIFDIDSVGEECDAPNADGFLPGRLFGNDQGPTVDLTSKGPGYMEGTTTRGDIN